MKGNAPCVRTQARAGCSPPMHLWAHVGGAQGAHHAHTTSACRGAHCVIPVRVHRGVHSMQKIVSGSTAHCVLFTVFLMQSSPHVGFAHKFVPGFSAH